MLPAKVFLLILALSLPALCGCGERASRVGQAPPRVRVLAFTSKTCGPCRRDKPSLDEMSRQVNVIFVDVDANPTTANQYGVISLPTYVILVDGKVHTSTHSLQHVRRTLRLK